MATTTAARMAELNRTAGRTEHGVAFGQVVDEVTAKFERLQPYDRVTQANRFLFHVEKDQRQLRPLKDALLDTTRRRNGEAPALTLKQRLTLTPHAYDQLGKKVLGSEHVSDFLARQPAPMMVANWNWGLANRVGEEARRPLMFRMVNTDETPDVCRAVLSDAYVPFDDVDVVQALDEAFAGDEVFRSAQVVLRSFHPYGERTEMRIVFPTVTRDLKVGDPCESGLIVRDCETGGLSVWFVPYVRRLKCLNGLRGPREVEDVLRMPHVTSASKMRQAIRDALDGLSGRWNAIYDAYKGAMNRYIESPASAFKRMEEAFKGDLSADDVKTIFDTYLAGNDGNSVFGMSMAVSQFAQTKTGDERLLVERIGGDVLAMDWN